jgi:hypothetical protein
MTSRSLMLLGSMAVTAASGCGAPVEGTEELEAAQQQARCRTASGHAEVTMSREYVSVNDAGDPVIHVVAELCGPTMSVEQFTRHYMSGRFAGPGPSEDNLFSDAVAEREVSPATPADVKQGVQRTVFEAHAMGLPIRTMSKIVQTLSVFDPDFARTDFQLFPAPPTDLTIVEALAGRFAIQIVNGDSPKRTRVFDSVLLDKLRRDGVTIRPDAVYYVERWNTKLDADGKGDLMTLQFPNASLLPDALNPKRAMAEFMGKVHAKGTVGAAVKVAARIDDSGVRPGGGGVPDKALYCDSSWVTKHAPTLPERTIFTGLEARQQVLVGDDRGGKRDITIWHSKRAGATGAVESLPEQTLRDVPCALSNKTLICTLPSEARFWNEVFPDGKARLNIDLAGLAIDTDDSPKLPTGGSFAKPGEKLKTFFSAGQTIPFQEYNCWLKADGRTQ